MASMPPGHGEQSCQGSLLGAMSLPVMPTERDLGLTTLVREPMSGRDSKDPGARFSGPG